MESVFVRQLRVSDITPVRRQVNTGCGWADVVDGKLVYELKCMRGRFSRATFYAAIGQAVVYAAALDLRPAVVVDEDPPVALRAALEKAGVQVIVFRQWWPCPRCDLSYNWSSAERLGWVKRLFCGDCEGSEA
jgi:hypothetical protein